MRVVPWLVAAVIAVLVYRSLTGVEIEHAPGVLAPADPVQRALANVAGIERGEFLLRPRAEFQATVRILDREDYSVGALAELVPTDFAVGWGPMSDSAVLAHIEISQSGRFYFWRTESWPIERGAIETHSANWHVIPGNATVRATLAGLRAGHVVELRGQLVDIEGGSGGMRTSLTRDDSGAGACEILLASQIRLLEPRKLSP